MPKIIAYLLVTSTSENTFRSAINDALDDGYQPFGAVSVSAYVYPNGESWAVYAQAMVRYEEGPL